MCIIATVSSVHHRKQPVSARNLDNSDHGAWNFECRKQRSFIFNPLNHSPFGRLAEWLFRNDNCSRSAQFSHQICIFPFVAQQCSVLIFFFGHVFVFISLFFLGSKVTCMKRFTEINWIVLCRFFFLFPPSCGSVLVCSLVSECMNDTRRFHVGSVFFLFLLSIRRLRS